MEAVVDKKEQFIGGLMNLSVADFNSEHQAVREEALKQLQSISFPTVKEEAWKYTRINALLNNAYSVQEPGSDLKADFWSIKGANTMVFVNGFYAEHLSHIEAEEGVEIMTLGQARIESGDVVSTYYNKFTQSDRFFTALNTAFNHTGAYVKVNPGVKAQKELHIVHLTTGDFVAAQPRHLIVVGDEGEMNITQHFESLDGNHSFTNVVAEVIVGDKAKCRYYSLQIPNDKSWLFTQINAYQATESNFETAQMSFSGKLVRNNLDIVVNGENCETTLNGAFMLNGITLVDNHTVVDHKVPNCVSNEDYKGVLSDQSRAVFNGKVFVRQEAQKTLAFQSNQNILLSDSAEIDTKPELEIYADDVKCSHGTTTGQLDEEALFYLQARGIPRERAQKMLVSAFIAEVTEELDSQALKDKIDELVTAFMQ